MNKDSIPPNITIKAKITIVSDILVALTDAQVEKFRKTCFGHWLDVVLKKNSQLLIHTILDSEVESVPNELSFNILGKRIRFRRQEFCLVTGLRFGPNMYMKEWVKDTTQKNPFRKRMFPDIPENVSVKVKDVMDIFNQMKDRSIVLEDDDAVKICLLVLLDNGFLGHQSSHNVSNFKLNLVDHLEDCWNIFPWGSYIWDKTYKQLRDAVSNRRLLHNEKRKKGEEIRYTLTGFVWAFMIWILEAIPATHVYAFKKPDIIPRALAWRSLLPFTWTRCCTLFDNNRLDEPFETLTPTKAESDKSWWKDSFEYFEEKHVQSEVLSEQVQVEKDDLSEEVKKKKKKRKRDSSSHNPTYDELKRTVSTLSETVSRLQGTIATFESRLLALEGDARDFGVVSDGDIAAYMSPGPSYTSPQQLYTSPAPTTQKSLPLANRRKLRPRRTPLRFKSPMIAYTRKRVSSTIPPPASTTTAPVTTMSVPMKDTIHTHLDASDAAQDTGFTEEDLEIIRIEKSSKPTFDLPDLSKIQRKKYPLYCHFAKNKIDCYLDCLRKGIRCEPSFWDVLYPGIVEGGKLEGLHINAFIELTMRGRNSDANWTLGLSDLVAFHMDSGKPMSMVATVDAFRATIDGTNPLYPSWDKISQVFFPINIDNEHWVAASWNLDDYTMTVYDSFQGDANRKKISTLLKKWKPFIIEDLKNVGWFEKTKRDPMCFKILLNYVKNAPQQTFKYGTQDCGVMTCMFIKMLTEGKSIDIEQFGDDVGLQCHEFRADMALMFYETRCERPV